MAISASGQKAVRGVSSSKYVYIRHNVHRWIPAIQMRSSNRSMATVTVPKFDDEQSLLECSKKAKYSESFEIDLSQYENGLLPVQNVDADGRLQDFCDMVKIPFMHEAAILYNLKQRHLNGKPYTRTGDIVIAMNPYRWFAGLYSQERRALYSRRLVWETTLEKDEHEDPRDSIEPHVYEVSALAYKGLALHGEDQSILVSGESGAGKTETVKICLHHIASVQRGPGHTGKENDSSVDSVVERVIQSNPLLEAFGNAKTRRNDNSSRFGKYLQLQFRRDDSAKRAYAIIDKPMNARLVGSKCDVYLLEKNRVVTHDDDERSFHIFHQLLAASNSEKVQFWEGLRDTTNESFNYVGYTETTSIEGVRDNDGFRETVRALELVGITGDKLRTLMRAICIVLQLGNLDFDQLDGDCDKSMVTTNAELEALADLMGVPAGELTVALTERTFKTNKESHKVPLNPEMAQEARDALAKEIYQKVFLWLVKTVNEATSANIPSEEESKFSTIGMLDIFGFEVFDNNGFEQLCINYANEKLQQKFNEDIFSNVKAEYEAEGISLQDICFDDNADVLNLIEGPSGLLSLLNEECIRPKGNDMAFVQKSLQANKGRSSLVLHRMDRMSFGIKHYAGGVLYDGRSFVAKNVDSLPLDLQTCAEKSSNIIVKRERAEIAPQQMERQRGTGRPNNRTPVTVLSKYKAQLSALMSNLRQTKSRYIRCIKPNSLKKPVLIEHQAVVDQLRCAGVVAGITIARATFPVTLPNRLVLSLYGSILGDTKLQKPPSENMTPEEKTAEQCKRLLRTLLMDKTTVGVNREGGFRRIKGFAVGKTRCYFRSGAYEYLEANRVRSLDKPVVVIQNAVRKWLERKEILAEQEALRKEEEKREQERREADARLEAIKQERKEKQATRQKEIQGLQEEIKQLEEAIRKSNEDTKNTIKSTKKRLEEVREDMKTIKSKTRDLENEMMECRITKVRQESKVTQAKKLIEFLKQQNRRARKENMKVKDKYERLASNNSKLHDSCRNFHASASGIEPDAGREEARNKQLLARMEAAKSLNKELKTKFNETQDKYMSVARERLQLQIQMSRVFKTVQEKSKNKDMTENIVVTGLQAEAEMKSEMTALDFETSESHVDFSEADYSINEMFSERYDDEFIYSL